MAVAPIGNPLVAPSKPDLSQWLYSSDNSKVSLTCHSGFDQVVTPRYTYNLKPETGLWLHARGATGGPWGPLEPGDSPVARIGPPVAPKNTN